MDLNWDIFTDFLRTTFDFQGLPTRTVNHRFVQKCTLPVQGCALAEPVGLRRLTFVLGRLENPCFFIVKLLGVTITNTLQWNCHVLDVIQKANKRIYFLILLKRANVPAHDIICFYLTCIRPVLEYCDPLYHHALPDYFSKDIEHIQNHALSIISPGLSYDDRLSMFNMASLEDGRIDQCEKTVWFYCI